MTSWAWEPAVFSCDIVWYTQSAHYWATSSYSLFCGVQELVFAATAITSPDAPVCPEPADCINEAPLQMGDLHCVHILQPLGIDLKSSKSHGILDTCVYGCVCVHVFCVCTLVCFLFTVRMTKYSSGTCPDAHTLVTTSVFIIQCVCVCVFVYTSVFLLTQVCVYLVLWVGVGDFECGHGCCHGLNCCEDVLKDAFGEGPPLLLRETTTMDDPHLSEKGGFPTLPSTWSIKGERL